MNYPRILSKVYGETWCITRAKYYAIHETLQARLNGAAAAFDDDGDEDEQSDEQGGTVGGTLIIPAFGILGKHLSGLEMMCGGLSVDSLTEQLDNALYDPRVRRVVMYWNSPGGVVTGVPELAEKMQEFRDEKILDSFCDDLCASGAIWLASQAPRFYCTGSAAIGSVGVYRLYIDETKALEMDGIKVTPIAAGKYKLMGAPFKPLTDEEIEMANKQVAAVKDQFDDAITVNRNVDAQYLEGQIYSGNEAAEYGLVDGVISDLEELLEMPDP